MINANLYSTSHCLLSCVSSSFCNWRQIKSPNIQKQMVPGEMRKDVLTDGHPHSLSQVWIQYMCVCVCSHVYTPWALIYLFITCSSVHIGSDSLIFFPTYHFCTFFPCRLFLFTFCLLTHSLQNLAPQSRETPPPPPPFSASQSQS